MMEQISFNLLEVLFGLLVLAGIVLFVVTCWRNVTRSSHDVSFIPGNNSLKKDADEPVKD